jgi:hypothetical protein
MIINSSTILIGSVGSKIIQAATYSFPKLIRQLIKDYSSRYIFLHDSSPKFIRQLIKDLDLKNYGLINMKVILMNKKVCLLTNNLYTYSLTEMKKINV